MTTRERIKRLRVSAGMSQADLADACGVKKTAISGWETGRTEPSLASLRLAARALGVPASALLGDGDEETAKAAG